MSLINTPTSKDTILEMKRDIPGTIEELTKNLSFLIMHLDDDEPPSKPIPLERLKNFARETYQDFYRSEMKDIIAKIKTRQQLTSEEIQLVHEFMIGDLETYTHLEIHTKQWVTDIHQILTKLQQFKDLEIPQDPKHLLTLQGMCMELDHTLKDFENYTYVQERINRFKRFIGTDPLQLTDTERFELAETLKDMLNSPLY
jgi:hypothetical protein